MTLFPRGGLLRVEPLEWRTNPGYRTERVSTVPESKNRRNRGSNKRSRKDRASSQQEEKITSPLSDADPVGLDDLELEDDGLPTWYRFTMFGLLLLGLLWICVFYISSGLFPIRAVGNWNVAIGFGVAMVGFFMTMRWK